MRLLIAGTASGCGKTTASLLVMAALQLRGLTVAPCKVGPDYIDPGFHRVVCGRPSENLDTFLTDSADIPWLMQNDADITVIEGVMGYYDGMDSLTMRCSAWELACLTQTPVILVVDASGGAASVAAQVKGFQTLRDESHIAGVLVNRVSGEHHYALVKEAVAHYTDLPCVGYLTKDTALTFPSRHLGLIPADELPDVRQRIFEAAQKALDTLDLDLMLSLAAQAPSLIAPEKHFPMRASYRLGIAKDEAFSFYYNANLRVLCAMGFELIPFSPLHDAELPQGLDGLYLGGGFPEVFAQQLASNTSMLSSIRHALDSGIACYAECGGMMYLCKAINGIPMVEFLPALCLMTKRLQRFGYVQVTHESGLTFPAHEFHHSVTDPIGNVHYAYHVEKASNTEKTWICGMTKGHTLAGYAHLHFLSHPELVDLLWPPKEEQA